MQDLNHEQEKNYNNFFNKMDEYFPDIDAGKKTIIVNNSPTQWSSYIGPKKFEKELDKKYQENDFGSSLENLRKKRKSQSAKSL